MPGFFTFRGPLTRLAYAWRAAVVFFSQHLLVIVAYWIGGWEPLGAPFWFLVTPLAFLIPLAGGPDLTFAVGLIALLITGAALVALTFRRILDADFDGWVASFAIAPIVQLPVILFFCVAPSRADEPPASAYGPLPVSWKSALVGVAAGMALTVFAVGVGALIFGTYALGIFVVAPFLIGATTAYLANLRADIGLQETHLTVLAALALGSIALVLVALEGIICIALAAPLAIGTAVMGGVFGREMAMRGQRTRGQSLSAFGILPVIFALEAAFPASMTFQAHQTVIIDAPTEVVWNSIVDMGEFDAPPTLPFRLGLAYAVRADITGEGVGAMRHGIFSTGVAIERVTEWIPGRKLSFVVLRDVPAMKELSPYEHVHAPHAVGYFTTRVTSFELSPRSDGRTELTERSTHELRLDPAFYWLPIARWAMNQNIARVLTHIKRDAEREFGQALPDPNIGG